jgi:lysine 2,3-aminomutase
MESMIKLTKQKMDGDTFTKESLKLWNDWRWQIKNAIRSVDMVEKVLGIKFSEAERAQFKQTIEIFPLSITPYYLSLIDTEDFRNDPIFKQAFPDIRELKVTNCDCLHS